METWNEIDEWIDQYIQGDLSGADRAELIKWLEASPEHAKQFRKILQAEMRVSAAGKWQRLDQVQERVWKRITLTLENRRKRLYLWGMRVASMVVVLIGIIFVWQIQQKSTVEFVPVASVLQAESGSPKAILVMNTGETIELKKGETRRVANIFGVGVIQDSTGGVRFEDRGEMEEEIGKSTIVVPEKGEYFVVLGDGTKVWINSGSELEFPNRFCGDIREVKLKGEAYFEVASNPQKLFYVLAGETKVRVLGTAFNVLAYQDDLQTEVALLRGKVSFDVADKAYVLTPGEIATLDRESGKTIIRKGDVAAIVDWKAGRFNFEDMPLEKLTVKLSRWYGVTFIFDDEEAKKLRFSGAVTKYRTLDYMLGMIEKTTDVSFELKEDKVVVSLRK
jgi:anti-fecI sigma factor, fecR|uniref:FecR domain-containing protein n=1 Tax=Butyricimonas faecalis TaxID=2093856 RepID=UPI003FEED447